MNCQACSAKRDDDGQFCPVCGAPNEIVLAEEIGQIVAERYLLLNKLKSTASGVIYLAEDLSQHSNVSVKLLHESASEKAVARLRHECTHLRQATNAHLIAIDDCGRTKKGQVYVVTRHLKGQTMAERIAQGALPLAEALGYLAQLARALVEPHQAGLLHLGMCPSSIFLEGAASPTLRLFDYGLAKLAETEKSSGSSTLIGLAIEKWLYMAPEQIAAKQVDVRTDLFIVGVVAYEMLTGTPAKALKTSLSPSKLNASIPVWLDELVKELTEMDAGKRVQTASILLERLQAKGSYQPANTPSHVKPATATPAKPATSLQPDPLQPVSHMHAASPLVNTSPSMSRPAPVHGSHTPVPIPRSHSGSRSPLEATGIVQPLRIDSTKKKGMPRSLIAIGAMIVGIVLVFFVAKAGDSEPKKKKPNDGIATGPQGDSGTPPTPPAPIANDARGTNVGDEFAFDPPPTTDARSTTETSPTNPAITEPSESLIAANSLPQIRSESESGYTDLSFVIRSARKSDNGDYEILAFARFESTVVGMGIFIKGGLKPPIERKGKEPTIFYDENAIALRSVGKTSNSLLAAMANIYSVRMPAASMKAETWFTAAAEQGNPYQLDQRQVTFRISYKNPLIFGEFAELYLRVQLADNKVTFVERDLGNRTGIIKALSDPKNND